MLNNIFIVLTVLGIGLSLSIVIFLYLDKKKIIIADTKEEWLMKRNKMRADKQTIRFLVAAAFSGYLVLSLQIFKYKPNEYLLSSINILLGICILYNLLKIKYKGLVAAPFIASFYILIFINKNILTNFQEMLLFVSIIFLAALFSYRKHFV